MKDSDTMAPAMAAGVVTRQIKVNGLSVTYHEAGQANTAHPPIVLVHGSSGSTMGHFGFLFPLLAVRHRVISLDMTMPVKKGEKLELKHLEAQVLAVMNAASPGQPVTLLGFSLGAVVAAHIAARQPTLIQNLVLLAGWAKTDTMMTFFNRTWFALRNAGVPEINDYTIYAAFGAPFLADKTVEMMTAGAMPLDDFVDAQMELNARPRSPAWSIVLRPIRRNIRLAPPFPRSNRNPEERKDDTTVHSRHVHHHRRGRLWRAGHGDAPEGNRL